MEARAQRQSVRASLRFCSNITFRQVLLSSLLLPSWGCCCFLFHTHAFRLSNWLTLGLPLFISMTLLSNQRNLPPSSHCPSGTLGTMIKCQDVAHCPLTLKTPTRAQSILRERPLFSYPLLLFLRLELELTELCPRHYINAKRDGTK